MITAIIPIAVIVAIVLCILAASVIQHIRISYYFYQVYINNTVSRYNDNLVHTTFDEFILHYYKNRTAYNITKSRYNHPTIEMSDYVVFVSIKLEGTPAGLIFNYRDYCKVHTWETNGERLPSKTAKMIVQSCDMHDTFMQKVYHDFSKEKESDD